MKQLLTLCLLIAVSLNSFANNEKYVGTMKTTMQMLWDSETPEGHQEAANKFERIASAEPDKWLPLYYQTFALILKCYAGIDADEIDPTLDAAQTALDKAMAIAPNESELAVLQSFLYSVRIGVDPMTRGMKYGPMSSQQLAIAEELNPENPRIYYMRGQSLMYTPEMYGGGMDKACPVFDKAKEKYASFEPASEIHPDWGEMYLDDLMTKCTGEGAEEVVPDENE